MSEGDDEDENNNVIRHDGKEWTQEDSGAYSDIYMCENKVIKRHKCKVDFVREHLIFSYLKAAVGYSMDRLTIVHHARPRNKQYHPREFRHRVISSEKIDLADEDEYALEMPRMSSTLSVRMEEIGQMKREDERNNARLFIIRDILKGLCFLHYYGLVHCDLKPINIFYDDTLGTCIGDLGSAFPTGCKNMNMTTHDYASGDEILTTGHDMFSLGIIIAEMWNPYPWMSSYVVESETSSDKKREFVIERSTWRASHAMSATVDDVNIIYGNKGGYYIHSPSNPDWKKATVINARGINISRLPDEWRDVVISLLAPNPEHRFSAISLLRKLDVNVFATYEKRLMTPLSSPTTTQMNLIKGVCSFMKPSDKDVKDTFFLYSAYGNLLGLDKKGEDVEQSKNHSEGGEVEEMKEGDRRVKGEEIDEKKMKIFLYLHAIISHFDPTEGEERDEREVFDTLTTDEVMSMFSSINFLHDLFWPPVDKETEKV